VLYRDQGKMDEAEKFLQPAVWPSLYTGVVKLLEAIKCGMENENEILAPVSVHGSGRALVCHQWEGLQLAALDPGMSVSLGSSPTHYMVLSVW
jgi:hypothetical protein